MSFDVAARFKWLTGFRKRKKERQRRGHAEVLEKERMDRINVMKEIREEAKKRWRELQWNEKRLDKLFDDNGKLMLDEGEGGSRRKKRRRAALVERAKAAEAAEAEAAEAKALKERVEDAAAPVTVGFDGEEGDPFGDVEVTTTLGCVGGPGGAADPAARRWLALLGQQSSYAGSRPEEEPERGLAIPSRELEEEARRWRRAEALRKEEQVRQAAMGRKITKNIMLKKKMRPKKAKKSSKKSGARGGKTGARARRKRK